MNESPDLLTILLIATISIGVFMLSLLVVKYRMHEKTHVLLFLIGLTLLWIQVEFLSIRMPFELDSSLFYGTRHGVWLLLGPLYYIYTRSSLGEGISRSGMILHFLPAAIFVLIVPLSTHEFLSSRQMHYGMLTVFDPFNDSVTWFQYIYSMVFIFQFLHLLCYLSVTYNFLKRYEMRMKQNFSALDTQNLSWSRIIVLLVMIGVFLISGYLTLMFVGMYYNQNADYLYVMPVSLLIYALAYRLAGVRWNPIPEEAFVKYEKSSLKSEQAVQYAEKLKSFMKDKAPYLKPDLRLQDLAKMLDIPTHHLSQVLNEHLKTSFFDYINRHRVERSKELIRTRPDATLLEIAFECGFNNKTSFSNAFKRFGGETATAFRRRVVIR